MKTMFLAMWILLSLTARAAPPDLLLLQKYTAGQPIQGWLLSEKLDGVRAYWNGKELISRQGNTFAAPDWFVSDLPPFELDGELWLGRGRFAETLSIVSRDLPHAGWRDVGYHVFEVPGATGGLGARLDRLRHYLATRHLPQVHIVAQEFVHNHSEVLHHLRAVEALGGEGLVLRNPHDAYQTGRSANALKVKSFEDAEGVVIGYRAGKGRFAGMVGSLLLELENGQQLAVGSGLSEPERRNPPPLGSVVTYRHHGYTRSGLPRFASFLRIRRPAQTRPPTPSRSSPAAPP